MRMASKGGWGGESGMVSRGGGGGGWVYSERGGERVLREGRRSIVGGGAGAGAGACGTGGGMTRARGGGGGMRFGGGGVGFAMAFFAMSFGEVSNMRTGERGTGGRGGLCGERGGERGGEWRSSSSSCSVRSMPSCVRCTAEPERASWGVFTTVAPEPRGPLRGLLSTSNMLLYIGSDIRIGFWDEGEVERESHEIGFVTEGFLEWWDGIGMEWDEEDKKGLNRTSYVSLYPMFLLSLRRTQRGQNKANQQKNIHRLFMSMRTLAKNTA
jgi:hypothetical protein